MRSRERVLARFAGEAVDRPPLWVGMSSEFEQKALKHLHLETTDALKKFLGDDFRTLRGSFVPPVGSIPGATPFGIPREGMGYGMATLHPLADIRDIGDLDRWEHWPDAAMIDVSTLRAEIQAYQGEYAIMSGDWSPFWHDAIDLLGMEQLYLLMYDAPELVHAVFDRIVNYYCQSSQKMFEEAGDLIDIMFVGNDFGSQHGALLSPELFREFILPYQKRLIDLGHQYQLKVQLHSCGAIAALLPDLINAGLDSIQALQCTCDGMNLTDLKEKFGNRIVLNGGIDSHHVLIDGTETAVRQTTLETLELMAGAKYIAGASHDSILEETPVENIVAMCQTVCQYRKSETQPSH